MAPTRIKPVILCGGSGTRLWPLSTPAHPKQFLRLLGEETMLEMTLRRVSAAEAANLTFSTPLVIGSARHEALIRRSAPDATLLLEPAGRNSAAPVAAASLLSDPDDLLLVLPADHDIADMEAFHGAIEAGAEAASAGAVVTFGIVASSPATGYGYVEAASDEGRVRPVARFVEKPNLETAQAYVSAGNFFWNAGIFLFRAGDMIAAFREHAADIIETVETALAGADSDAATLDPAVFGACRSQSIDYAIMEHLSSLQVVPVEMGWSDIGDFRALWERSVRDEAGNALVGEVRAERCENCYIHANGLPVSVADRRNEVIIATPDEVMICDLGDPQAVKALAKQ